MRIFPYDAFTIEIDSPLEVVVKRLAVFVSLKPVWWASLEQQNSYWGFVNDREFKIHPVLGYRNSFAPIIYGRFRDDKTGTIVEVRLRMHWGMAILMGVLVAFTALVFVAAIHGVMTGVAGIETPILPAILFAGVLGASWGGFWFEARHIRRHLVGILTGTQSKPRPINPMGKS